MSVGVITTCLTVTVYTTIQWLHGSRGWQNLLTGSIEYAIVFEITQEKLSYCNLVIFQV